MISTLTDSHERAIERALAMVEVCQAIGQRQNARKWQLTVIRMTVEHRRQVQETEGLLISR